MHSFIRTALVKLSLHSNRTVTKALYECLPTYMYLYHKYAVFMEVAGGYHITWNWSYRLLYATSGSFGRTSVFNHWAISLALRSKIKNKEQNPPVN